MKKILSVAGAVILASLSLTACGGQDGLKKVRVNEVTHSIFYAPMYLADSLGYFKDEGIKIELTNGGGANKVMTAILSNEADIGFCGPEAALYVETGGAKDTPTVFGQLTKRDGSFLVSRVEEKNFDWNTLKGKEILAGRRGGVPAMTFEYVLKQKGFTAAELNINYDVEFNLMTGAFEAGTADYCTMFEPTASEYQAAGKGYIVASVGEESGEIPYTAYIAKRTWLDKNKETAEGFLRAILRAIKYLDNHTVTEVAPLLKGQFPATSEQSIATSLNSYIKIDAWQKDMAMTEASFNRLQDVIELAGELEKRVEFTSLVDNTIVKKVYASL